MQLLRGTDFHYTVDVHFDTGHIDGCCSRSDLCRCSTVDNPRVANVDTCAIADRLVKGWLNTGMKLTQTSDSVLLTYSVERVLTAGGVYLPDDWTVDIVGGYYGEEIGRVHWTGPDRVELALAKLAATNDPTEWVRVALTAEYGFVLDELAAATFHIATVNLDDIHVTRPAKPDRRKPGNDNTMPAGLVLDNGTRLRLIDGHHRLTNMRVEGRKQARYVVARVAEPAHETSLHERRETAAKQVKETLANLTELAALADSDIVHLTSDQQNTLRDITARLCRPSNKTR